MTGLEVKVEQLQFAFMRDVNLQCYNRKQAAYIRGLYETMPQLKPPYTSFIQFKAVSEIAELFYKEHYNKYHSEDYLINDHY
jgi:hypothetical protein